MKFCETSKPLGYTSTATKFYFIRTLGLFPVVALIWHPRSLPCAVTICQIGGRPSIDRQGSAGKHARDGHLEIVLDLSNFEIELAFGNRDRDLVADFLSQQPLSNRTGNQIFANVVVLVTGAD